MYRFSCTIQRDRERESSRAKCRKVTVKNPGAICEDDLTEARTSEFFEKLVPIFANKGFSPSDSHSHDIGRFTLFNKIAPKLDRLFFTVALTTRRRCW